MTSCQKSPQRYNIKICPCFLHTTKRWSWYSWHTGPLTPLRYIEKENSINFWFGGLTFFQWIQIFFFFFHTWFFHQRFMLGTSVDLFFYCCFGLVCNYSCKLENLVCTCGFFFFLCLHFWTSFAEFKCSVL